MREIKQHHLNSILDALCRIANNDLEAFIEPYDIAEEAFNALDRGDGKNDYVFQCGDCQQWKIRSLEYATFGDCDDCFQEGDR